MSATTLPAPNRVVTPSALYPTGVFSAAVSPVHADLTPDHAAFAVHCRTLLEEGCDGIALLGTTGEANSFSAAERQAMLEGVVRGGIAPDKLLPGTGIDSFMEMMELTNHALSLGVPTIVMLLLFYYKNVTEDGLFAAYAAAADLAFIFRNHADPAQAGAVEAAQARVVATRNRVSQFAQIASIKVLLAQKNGRLDWALVRPPLLPLTAEAAQL